MIIRIVKMTFHPEKVNEFLTVFDANKSRIAGFEGCTKLELLNDINNSNIYFTYSHWKGEEFLEKYRNSELFNTVWAKTKILFTEKAEVWSLKVQH